MPGLSPSPFQSLVCGVYSSRPLAFRGILLPSHHWRDNLPCFQIRRWRAFPSSVIPFAFFRAHHSTGRFQTALARWYNPARILLCVYLQMGLFDFRLVSLCQTNSYDPTNLLTMVLYIGTSFCYPTSFVSFGVSAGSPNSFIESVLAWVCRNEFWALPCFYPSTRPLGLISPNRSWETSYRGSLYALSPAVRTRGLSPLWNHS